MKIDVERRLFLEAFNDVSGLAPKSSPRPILASVLIDASEGETTLVATDGEVSMRRRVLGVETLEPGRAVLPADRVGKILRASEDGRLTIQLEGSNVRVLGDRDEFELTTESPDLFPTIPEWDHADPSATVAAADLRSLIRRTAFACDPDSQRYALGGCYVESTPGTLALVGTDGRRMARHEVPAAVADGFNPPGQQSILPVKAMRLIDRILDDGDASVELALDANLVKLRIDRAEVYARLVCGRFPAHYREGVPSKGFVVETRISAGKLLSAIDRARVTLDLTTSAIQFAFGDDCLTLSSFAASAGKSRVQVPVRHDGGPLTAAYDADYLAEGLKSLPADLDIEMRLINGREAVVFNAPSWFYVAFPITVG